MLQKIADVFLIIGTSLNVYPAAGLVHSTSDRCLKFLVDPAENIKTKSIKNITVINEKATTGVAIVASILQEKYVSA